MCKPSPQKKVQTPIRFGEGLFKRKPESSSTTALPLKRPIELLPSLNQLQAKVTGQEKASFTQEFLSNELDDVIGELEQPAPVRVKTNILNELSEITAPQTLGFNSSSLFASAE